MMPKIAFPGGEGGPLAVDEVSHKQQWHGVAAKQIFDLLYDFLF